MKLTSLLVSASIVAIVIGFEQPIDLSIRDLDGLEVIEPYYMGFLNARSMSEDGSVLMARGFTLASADAKRIKLERVLIPHARAHVERIQSARPENQGSLKLVRAVLSGLEQQLLDVKSDIAKTQALMRKRLPVEVAEKIMDQQGARDWQDDLNNQFGS